LNSEIPNPKSPIRNAWWVALPTLVIAWCAYLMMFGPTQGIDLPPPELKDEELLGRADYNWELKDLEGKPVTLDPYRGKVMFLNIWNTNCGPCVKELPSIASLAANPRLKDVAFVCVSTDEDAGLVRRFLDKRQIKLPIVLRADKEPPRIFKAAFIPATFLVAPNGRIANFQEGNAQWDVPDVVDRLEALTRRK